MRLPGALSRLAAPFFGSQAEPFSRRRGISGFFCSVCLAFLVNLFVVVGCLACAWCHYELWAHSPLHSASLVIGVASSFMAQDKYSQSISEVAFANIRVALWVISVFGNGFMCLTFLFLFC